MAQRENPPTPEFIQTLKELNVHFGDSLVLAKQLLKAQHPELRVDSSGKCCQASLECLYSTFFDESFPAHDAREDVKALQRVYSVLNFMLLSI